MSPIVSVIIPNYNHGKFLQRRIESVLGQTFQDFELILLDDASTDESRAVMEPYRTHPKMASVIYNEHNSGSTFSQWKKGFELAKGQFIWIAESDDWCEPTLLEELVRPMISDAKLVLSYCQSVLIAADTEKILDLTKAEALAAYMDGSDFVRRHLLVFNDILNASMVVFRRAAIQPFPEEILAMKYCGDWYLWASICAKGNVFISGKYLNYYSRHHGSSLTTASKQGYDFLEGNKVFHLVTSLVKLSEEERRTALEGKIQYYHHLEPYFANEQVRTNVLQSMTQLDAVVPEMINRKAAGKQNSTFGKMLSRIKQRMAMLIG